MFTSAKLFIVIVPSAVKANFNGTGWHCRVKLFRTERDGGGSEKLRKKRDKYYIMVNVLSIED